METVKIFCCYAPEDKELMEGLRVHLRMLERMNVSVWYAHDILPGTEWERERDEQLHASDIILLLVSPYLIGSPEYYDKEVLPAMERHNRGEARVIPIILRPVDWRMTCLSELSPLPMGGRPVTNSDWDTLDHAFFNIFTGIKQVINDIRSAPISSSASTQLEQIMHNFKQLRQQITNVVSLQGLKDFSLEKCEGQYNKLYGDTLVFLATYAPETVSDDAEGFVEIVYRKTAEKLSRNNLFDVLTLAVTRSLIPPLARLEKVGMQIDACLATLELYKQRYPALSE